jgi:hypothetical protein
MLVVGLLFAAGLASTAEGQRRRVALPLYGAQVVMDTIGERVEIQAPPGQTFAAAALVLQNFGIEADVRDSVGGLLGNIGLVRTRRLNRTPLSVFLNCGSSMTGLRADYYRVMMPLLIMFDPAGADRTSMRIALVASAQDPTGTSNQPVLCGSTGALETRMRKAIEEQVLVLRGGSPR